jgi:hypothetical protein
MALWLCLAAHAFTSQDRRFTSCSAAITGPVKGAMVELKIHLII